MTATCFRLWSFRLQSITLSVHIAISLWKIGLELEKKPKVLDIGKYYLPDQTLDSLLWTLFLVLFLGLVFGLISPIAARILLSQFSEKLLTLDICSSWLALNKNPVRWASEESSHLWCCFLVIFHHQSPNYAPRVNKCQNIFSNDNIKHLEELQKLEIVQGWISHVKSILIDMHLSIHGLDMGNNYEVCMYNML